MSKPVQTSNEGFGNNKRIINKKPITPQMAVIKE
jgi:hypothetical protein